MRSAPPTSGGPRVRTFIAIELAPPARPAVEAYLEGLKALGADVAWTAPSNLHLTLKFLGGVEPAHLERVVERLRPVAAAQAPLSLTVSGLGAFPSVRRPRVLWVGMHAPDLGDLAVAVDRACVAEGFEPEQRPFHPHVTLGRVREEGSRRRPRAGGGPSSSRERKRPFESGSLLAERFVLDRAREFGASPADTLVVFRSHLAPTGARHEALWRLTFGASPIG